MRQVLFGAGTYHLVDRNFEPLPDYWLSLLFKKLVGTKVLTASVRGPERSKLRVYLHCTNNNHPQYKEGALTLYALNLHNVTKRLQLPRHLGDKQVDKYLMQPSGPDGLLSKSVQLNGQTLKMVNDQTLPALTEKPSGQEVHWACHLSPMVFCDKKCQSCCLHLTTKDIDEPRDFTRIDERPKQNSSCRNTSRCRTDQLAGALEPLGR